MKFLNQLALSQIFNITSVIVCFSLTACSQDNLTFPEDNFTIESKTVYTSEGAKEVSYKLYKNLVYVSNPVDTDYQSMNIYVPVEVDGEAVNPENAPILFHIRVGGYFSVNNVKPRTFGHSSKEDGTQISKNVDLALAAGYVVAAPGCRGWDNKAEDGTYFGKAPAAIVDLKAAVRYLKLNAAKIPGDETHIVSTGVSAGGALSALLGASGNNELYEPFLKNIGAADTDDEIFAVTAFCPITDLDHADMAYEWMYGENPTKEGLVDQDLSKALKLKYAAYQQSLGLKGMGVYGTLTADSYEEYLLEYYLYPSANKFLTELSEAERITYLGNNKWISWSEDIATFNFSDYVSHVGRMKGLPAFDDFAKKAPEPQLFGTKTLNARHFTAFSQQHETGIEDLEADLKMKINMMNAMFFIMEKSQSKVNHWWLRQGSSDNHTSQTVIANLTASLENQGKEVNAFLYWDEGHGSDLDPEEMIKWIADITIK